MMWMFWGRCEWELILELDDDDLIWLIPWAGCREPEKVSIEVGADNTFDWLGFLRTKNLNINDQVKIDVYDQLKYRWEDFITYLWTTRQKYARWNKKFEE